MPNPFKSLFPPRKPLDQDEATDSDTGGNPSPAHKTGFFVKKPLYRTTKPKRHSDIPFVEGPMYGKGKSESSKPEKLDRPFLFPQGLPKAERESLFGKVASSLRDTIKDVAHDRKIKREMAKARRNQKQAERASSPKAKKQATNPASPSPHMSPQEQRFERLVAIYQDVYGETRDGLMKR